MTNAPNSHLVLSLRSCRSNKQRLEPPSDAWRWGRLRAAAAAAIALVCLLRQPAHAADVIVQPPCTEAALRNAVTQVDTGGTITLNCPATPIVFAQPIAIGSGKTVVFRGGGTVVLSGGGKSRLFEVADGATLRLQDLTLQQGAATSHGGAVTSAGILHIENSNLLNNEVTGGAYGGAIASSGSLRIEGGNLQGNRAAAGGAIYLYGAGSSVFAGVRMAGNVAIGSPGTGGAFVVDAGTSLSVSGGAFLANGAVYGGTAAVADGATVVIADALFQNNDVSLSGGAVFVGGAVTVTESRFVANSGNIGGSFHVGPTGELTVVGAMFTDGLASISGAAIDNEGTLKLSQSTVQRMTTSAEYAAVDNSGTATIVNTLFLDNIGADANSLHNHSQTLLNPSQMALIHVTVLGRRDGGLAEVINNGTLTMKNSNFCTITNDFTCFEGTSPEAKVTQSLGGNFFSDQGCMVPKPTDTLGICAPLIEQPAPDEIGPKEWAPIIDAVDCTPDAPVDIRGVARPQNGKCDAGAFELLTYEAPKMIWLPLVKGK